MADPVLSAALLELKSLVAHLGEIVDDEFPRGAAESPFAKSVRIQVADIRAQIPVVERAVGLENPVPGAVSNPQPIDFFRVSAEAVRLPSRLAS